MTILLLEPNRLLAKQYSEFLEQNGHKVVWRQNAQSGIGAADEQKPDLVIAELLLTGHSGVEFLYEFRSYGDWQNIPVILLASVDRSEAGVSLEALKELKVGAYFYKPEMKLADLAKTALLLTKVNKRQT